jgi:hypothetical protein
MEGQNKCYHYVYTVPWKDKTNVTIMFTQYHGPCKHNGNICIVLPWYCVNIMVTFVLSFHGTV